MSGAFCNFVNLIETKQQVEMIALHRHLLVWIIEHNPPEIDSETMRFGGAVLNYNAETKQVQEKIEQRNRKNNIFGPSSCLRD